MTKTYGAKTLAVVIVMTMVLAVLSACGGNGGSGGSDNDKVVGRWNASTIEAEGITMDVETAFAALGMEADMYFEFGADGNCSLSMMGISMEGTYKVSGSKLSITIDGDTETIDIDGDTLVMEDPDIGKVIFTKA